MFLLVSFSSCAQSKKEIIPETYVAYKTSEVITIDGNANEAVWGEAKWTNNFIDIEGDKIPTYQTNVKMLWDENYYYVLAEIKEPHIWANLKQRDTIIFYNNDFEIFIDPDGDTHNYYEIELNAYNTIWDLFISKPYREGNVVLNDWTATGLKSAIKINGTINNPKDVDTGWTIEMAIPWAAYKKSYFEKNVPENNFWRVNFSRVNWNFDVIDGKYYRKKDKKGKFLHEYNWVWSPTGVINMHEPEKWGYVYFSSKEPRETVLFEIPQDDPIKWRLYETHRALRAYFKKHNSYPESISSLTESTVIVNGAEVKIEFEKHSSGYNLYAVSPFSKKTLMIKEDGKFISK